MASDEATAGDETMREGLSDTLERQSGLLFAEPAIVSRSSYGGSGLFRDRTGEDPRPGYLPVEWWVLSCVRAENEAPRAGEGETRVRLADGRAISLRAVLDERALFGDVASRWPLIKVLDIGGAPTSGVGRDRERPPIPPHVHSGSVVGGRLRGRGKRESYFFLPAEAPPDEPEPITRIGLREGVAPRDLLCAVEGFGRGDEVYELLNDYAIRPRESWLVPDRVAHAPGPWPTVEMQTPQDDFNLLAWQLSQRLEGAALERERGASMLRGLKDARTLVESGVEFGERGRGQGVAALRREVKSVSRVPGVRRTEAFVDPFRGELLELDPGARVRVEPEEDATAFLVWSGAGSANGLRLDAADWDTRECLLAPSRALELEASRQLGLVVVRFLPLSR